MLSFFDIFFFYARIYLKSLCVLNLCFSVRFITYSLPIWEKKAIIVLGFGNTSLIIKVINLYVEVKLMIHGNRCTLM